MSEAPKPKKATKQPAKPSTKKAAKQPAKASAKKSSTTKKTAPKKPASKASAKKAPAKSAAAKAGAPKLLSGGNPQIPKGDGDAPVQAYIAAMPEWKRPVGERLDALVVRAVPDVRKAVKWNQPFYGSPAGEGWFMAFRCYTRYVQVQLLRGTSLDPEPPKGSSHPEVRYLDIYEDDELDEALLTSWFEQASQLPGVKL